METLVEIHSYYQTQIEIAKRVDQVYDFALPPLILHSFFSQDSSALAKWLNISPRNCITVLDTHDGIGIIDVGPMGDKPGLLSDAQIHALVETMHDNTKGESRKATGAAASNVDLYQVNSTYYDALAKDDFNYLLARAIQFFSPGIPQVYYGGLLGQENDMALLAKTNVGRDINRPYLNREKIKAEQNKSITRALAQLINIRNQSDAFNGEFSIDSHAEHLTLAWDKQGTSACLSADLKAKVARITLTNLSGVITHDLSQLLGK